MQARNYAYMHYCQYYNHCYPTHLRVLDALGILKQISETTTTITIIIIIIIAIVIVVVIVVIIISIIIIRIFKNVSKL